MIAQLGRALRFSTVIFLCGCALFRQHKIEWNALRISVNERNWKITDRSDDKLAVENSAPGTVSGIYFEFIKVPQGRNLSLDELLNKTLETYRLVYDGIRHEKIVVDGLAGYRIEHHISSEGKTLLTTIIPIAGNYLAIVGFGKNSELASMRAAYENGVLQIAKNQTVYLP